MTAHHHCREFSRAELLRGGAARAGAGLPAIEPGMPAPAGTGLSRRSFMARSAGLALAVYGSQMLAPAAFEDGIAAAAAASPSERVLVSVFCAGGLDSLSLLAPVGHADYAGLRPTLGVARSANPLDVFTEDTSLQWHPEAGPLRDLHLAGKLTVLPSIGYDDANQSHFTSRHFWEVGQTDVAAGAGWLGRFLDRHGVADNPLQGLALDSSLAPALAPRTVPVAAVGAPEDYGFWTRDVWDSGLRSHLMSGWAQLGGLPTADGELAKARGAVRMTDLLRTQLAPMQGVQPFDEALVPYPQVRSAFPRRLAALAEMLETGLPVRCVAVRANGGYDTHDNQAATLPGDIAVLAQTLAAFQADLEARGLADRVLVHVWSEFGRRAKENGSGTDHGAGGVSLVLGTQASGRMAGEFPGIRAADLVQGNLRHTVDFRAVYKGLLEQWLAVDAAPIVPGADGFTAPALVRA